LFPEALSPDAGGRSGRVELGHHGRKNIAAGTADEPEKGIDGYHPRDIFGKGKEENQKPGPQREASGSFWSSVKK